MNPAGLYPESPTTIALIGNHLPRQCGIATFTTDLLEALSLEAPDTDCWAMWTRWCFLVAGQQTVMKFGFITAGQTVVLHLPLPAFGTFSLGLNVTTVIAKNSE